MNEKKTQKIEKNDKSKFNSQVKNSDENLEDNSKDEKKLDPTRYGDWEVNGIAVDF